MNCANHTDAPATAFCRECGKPMCAECQRSALGSVYCAEHLPAPAAPAPQPPRAMPNTPPTTFAASPYTAPAAPQWSTDYGKSVADPGAHPLLALLLGFIPGVGAIYNGQYAKGLIHAVVFGILVSIVSNHHGGGAIAPLMGIMIAAWVFYQAFEAFHTARKRRYGMAVEEFSSIFDTRPAHGRFPVGAILLIGIGFILLLDTTDIISIDMFARYWPALLIVFGLYMLYNRLEPADRHAVPSSNAPASQLPDGSGRR